MPVLDNDPFIVGDDAPTNRTPPSLTALHSDDIVVGPKPVTYYGEGPFDPPSSDEEADELLEKSPVQDGSQANNNLGFEEDGLLRVGQRKVCSLSQSRVWRKYTIISEPTTI